MCLAAVEDEHALTGRKLDRVDVVDLDVTDDGVPVEQALQRVATELEVLDGASVAGKSLRESRFRQQYQVIVLAVARTHDVRIDNLAREVVRPGDRILVQGRREDLVTLSRSADFRELEELTATRPTAVNLRWAIDRMTAFIEGMRGTPVSEIKAALFEEAQRVLEEIHRHRWDGTNAGPVGPLARPTPSVLPSHSWPTRQDSADLPQRKAG